jgi:hypothetical protein
MEAGIASHVWSIEEIVQLPDYKWHIGFILKKSKEIIDPSVLKMAA